MLPISLFSGQEEIGDLLESKCPREVKNDRPDFGAPSINGSAEVGDSIYHAVYQSHEHQKKKGVRTDRMRISLRWVIARCSSIICIFSFTRRTHHPHGAVV